MEAPHLPIALPPEMIEAARAMKAAAMKWEKVADAALSGQALGVLLVGVLIGAILVLVLRRNG